MSAFYFFTPLNKYPEIFHFLGTNINLSPLLISGHLWYRQYGQESSDILVIFYGWSGAWCGCGVGAGVDYRLSETVQIASWKPIPALGILRYCIGWVWLILDMDCIWRAFEYPSTPSLHLLTRFSSFFPRAIGQCVFTVLCTSSALLVQGPGRKNLQWNRLICAKDDALSFGKHKLYSVALRGGMLSCTFQCTRNW